MPVYYLNFYRLVEKLLGRLGLRAEEIDRVVYSNISRMDQERFARMLGVPASTVYTRQLAEYGHTFASDLVINYTDLRREARITRARSCFGLRQESASLGGECCPGLKRRCLTSGCEPPGDHRVPWRFRKKKESRRSPAWWPTRSLWQML